MPRIDKRAKLAQLAELRKAGKKTFDAYEVGEVQDLYEEVDEDGYKKIVRDRLNQDDFVVDDHGEGYADDGREDWDRVQHYESGSEDEVPIREKKCKNNTRQRDEEQAKRDATNRDISDFLSRNSTKARIKAKIVKTEEDDQFLASLLGEVDQNVHAAAPPKSKKRDWSAEKRRSRIQSPAPKPRSHVAKRVRLSPQPVPSPTPDEDTFMDDDDIVLALADDNMPALLAGNDVPTSDPAPSSPIVNMVERKTRPKFEPENAEDEEMMQVAHAGAVTTESVNLTASRVPKKTFKTDPHSSPANLSSNQSPAEPAVDSSAWNEINQRLHVISSSIPEPRGINKIDYKDAIEKDGSLHMFWTDYTEVRGCLCLFGKVLNKKTGSYVSCFVKVDNILRKLFFLPRQNRVVDGEATSDEVGMMDVYTDIDALMTKMRVGMFKIKPCDRKYAFELPGIPKEAQYMKLFYPYTKPQINVGSAGETYSHVFGTNTALFEQFVLWKNIMGPCWLQIKDADFDALKNASHCRLEILVEDPNMISPLSDSGNLDAPLLTLMSMAMRTSYNAKDNKQEIISISARIYDKVSLTDTTPADKLPSRTFTLIRPNGTNFPMGFEQMARSRKHSLIKAVKLESEMLNFLLAQMDVVDPDVILGHQLEGVDYSVLLNRLRELKIRQWSRLGRLRRSEWPSSIGKVGSQILAERQIITGRLLCDLANDAGKSAMHRCSTWSLTEMCSLYLSGDNKRRDIDSDTALQSWAKTKDGLMDYVSHVETDTYFITALAVRVQLLPLTKILTNLAGNSWARTLTGTRAERNEYILLHEFHRNRYICPDKPIFRGGQRVEGENADVENGDSKKGKYKGGLVFEPEKALYDKFVLVMDFNSLYPSIIQEFNICFTTVDRSLMAEDDEVPDVPAVQDQGILPKLIASLVSRRREVKKLMKNKHSTVEQLATWDIQQLALKLTANSMYGCLGYTKSRFYARPLAVLTTYKGREILRRTKDLAESKSLQVIYGDTDSVMINANVDNVSDAYKVGQDFKKAVNDSYRLLEIDIDHVFRRILLQAKKKYAAISMIEQDGTFIEKMEVKGLDMKRREYCGLSKEISSRLLNEILSGDDVEVSIQRVHEYLRDISKKMREQAIPVQKYIILTQLGKSPKDYPNADSMPQVQVALRELARGKTVRRGDVISYIITGDSRSSETAAKRAYSPQDVLKTGSGLSPDVDWYIGKQVFPPVERLCANIVGTSTAQLAECLGLDAGRYAKNANTGSKNTSNDLDLHPLESQIPDEVRFRDCQRLQLRCRLCKKKSMFEGVGVSMDCVTPAGVACGLCGSTIPTLSVVAQLEHAVRSTAAAYYEGWLVCDDSSCGNRTRQMSVYGSRCLGPNGLARDCLGRMRYETRERDMYNQLLYFASLWDVDKAKDKAHKDQHAASETRERILALAEHNRKRFGTLKGIVNRYLDKCGWQWVAMDALFAKMGFVADT